MVADRLRSNESPKGERLMREVLAYGRALSP
jgi:hypothetical protein